MEFDMKKMVSVKNRSAGIVIYKIPDRSITREFKVAEEKQIPYEELVWLSYQDGGRDLMENFLQIKDIAATESLDIHTEQEYFMSEEDVIKLLREGSLDALLDALDFAPEGVIHLIKDLSVSLPLYDMQKREAIQKATGFNVTAAIEYSRDDEDEAKAPAATRRVQSTTETPNAPTRRTENTLVVENKYNVVNK